MDRILYRLFDFQKFEQSKALSAVIESVHKALYGRAIPDDELQVWAAGDSVPNPAELPEHRHDEG